jgi:Domain of unknown function (DUF4350)
MSKRNYLSTLALCALVAVFAVGLFQIFRIRLVAGDLYPQWSSLRSDPDGTRVLFDSLAATGRVVTARKYKTLAQSPERSATILFLGYSPNALLSASNSELDGFEQSARSGNRLVFAMNPGQWSGPPKQEADSPLAKKWGVAIHRVPANPDDDIELYFAKAANWAPDVTEKGRAVVIERAFGSGSIVLTASSEVFANQNLAADRNSMLLIRLVGGNARVIFDESHLGVQDTGSVLGLVHKYRLDGALWGLLALAIAFVWSNGAGFPPPEPRLAATTAGHDSRTGLAQLLRRQIPTARIIDVCVSEWERTNTRAKLPRPHSGTDPIETYRRFQQELTSK